MTDAADDIRWARIAGAVAVARIGVGAVVIGALVYTYALRISVGDGNPFDYFGYFTNQTSFLTSIVLIATGVLVLTGRRVPEWLATVRGVATACMLIVGLIYNTLVPGTGSAPPWVNVLLHVVFPLVVALDWFFVGDRQPLPWRRLWLVLPYPLLWLTVVLIRGVSDGWVPYGFLLPERGLASLALYIVGLLAALTIAGALVWAVSRLNVSRANASRLNVSRDANETARLVPETRL